MYSTDAERMCPECRRTVAECVCKARAAPAGDGVVRVSRETKGRGGKSVTLIRGLALDSVYFLHLNFNRVLLIQGNLMNNYRYFLT